MPRASWSGRRDYNPGCADPRAGDRACAAIFTVVNAVLLRPFPFPAAERMMVVNESLPGQPTTTVATGKYVEWKAQAQSFEQLGAMASQS